MTTPLRVFLSYAREDEQIVESIYVKLLVAGTRPWMDTKDLIPGQKWKDTIDKAIRTADLFCIFISRNSVSKRGHLQKEIRTALETFQDKLPEDIFVIPIRLDDSEMPSLLNDYQWVDLSESTGWFELMKTIQFIRETSAADQGQTVEQSLVSSAHIEFVGHYSGQTALRDQISSFDPGNGTIKYRGYDIAELVKKTNFLESAYLTVFGSLPTAEELSCWMHKVTYNSTIGESVVKFMTNNSVPHHPIHAIVRCLPMLTLRGGNGRDIDDVAALIAKLPLICAGLYHMYTDTPLVYSRYDLNYSENILHSFFATPHEPYRIHPIRAHILDKVFIILIDHEQTHQAGTLRPTYDSRASAQSTLADAVATLFGPMHDYYGNATQQMLVDLRGKRDVSSLLEQIRTGLNVPGLHPEWMMDDPRIRLLRTMTIQMLDELGRDDDVSLLLELDERMQRDDYCQEHGLSLSQDAYMFAILSMLGFPPHLFSSLCTIPRSVGLLARWVYSKQRQSNDQAVGSVKNRVFVPLADRVR